MEAKYYTPTIEEFHVGFECEVYDNDYDVKTPSWIKYVLEDGNDIKNVISWLNKNEVRVKYLDREDIVLLGWEIDNHDNFYFKVNENWGYSLYYDKVEDIYTIDNGQEYEMRTQYFMGKIRNKSELKKIMQMLNIKNK